MARFESGLTCAAAETARGPARRVVRTVRGPGPGGAGPPGAAARAVRADGGRAARGPSAGRRWTLCRWPRWRGSPCTRAPGTPVRRSGPTWRGSSSRGAASRSRRPRRSPWATQEFQRIMAKTRNPVLAVVDFPAMPGSVERPLVDPVPLSPVSLVWRKGLVHPAFEALGGPPPRSWRGRRDGSGGRPDGWIPATDELIMTQSAPDTWHRTQLPRALHSMGRVQCGNRGAPGSGGGSVRTNKYVVPGLVRARSVPWGDVRARGEVAGRRPTGWRAYRPAGQRSRAVRRPV